MLHILTVANGKTMYNYIQIFKCEVSLILFSGKDFKLKAVIKMCY